MTPDADRRVLLQLARDAIVAHTAKRSPPPSDMSGVLGASGGAFVTLHVSGQLRGCIGHIGEVEPLGRIISRCAVAASSEDPRFAPITAAEVSEILIEVSLLGPLEPIAGPADIEIGRHGLVVEQGWHRGLLLPQVATEWHWDRETFFAQACLKAGLARDAWKHVAKLWRFEAEVFSEPIQPSVS